MSSRFFRKFRSLITGLLCLFVWFPTLVGAAPMVESRQDKPTADEKNGQQPDSTKDQKNNEGEKTKDTPQKPPKAEKDQKFKAGKPSTWTAEQLAEVVLFAYGSRPVQNYVTTNMTEDGVIRLSTGEDTPPMEGRFTRRVLRKESSDKDCVRVDVVFPKQTFTFGFNGVASWAAQDGNAFTPKPEAEASFLASLTHDYWALLRYKEDGTTLTRAGSERITGIETSILELTHKDQTKTRYFISDKSYRILHLEYEIPLAPGAPPTKFRESFYDFRNVQGVLVPGRTVLYENGKFVQEIELKETKCRLAKLDEEIFLRF
ncbi:MAG TPA: hypothetical protein PLS70_13310 [Acidobacteriota bacterium]|nr:hypothetical protein [Acidobacteriota bacterium]